MRPSPSQSYYISCGGGGALKLSGMLIFKIIRLVASITNKSSEVAETGTSFGRVAYLVALAESGLKPDCSDQLWSKT